MLLIKYLLLTSGFGLLGSAGAVLAIDALRRWPVPGRPRAEGAPPVEPLPPRWRLATTLTAAGGFLLAVTSSLVVVPSGMAAIRVSQLSGTLPGTLYPGTHVVAPLVHQVALYAVRDSVYTTSARDLPQRPDSALKVQSKEGLPIGLSVSVRYRLDPERLPHIHNSLPQPVESEIVAPVVSSVFRQTVPDYMVREIFATRREELRRATSEAVTRKLAADGVLVKELMLRDVILPPEYAKGLEGLLIKVQENEQLSIELEVKQKLVRTAELEAEANKARQVKQAEAQAQMTVLQAKAQADAMQHTLPLKEKQIQQSRLEAEARKEATVKNAEAMAQAKVIDSRAEVERQGLMAKAEEQRIRLLAGAEAERMKAEAQVLKDNPLLIQKIVAERLSDKVQIMMVPMDGKFFFANDVLRGTPAGVLAPRQDDRQ